MASPTNSSAEDLSQLINLLAVATDKNKQYEETIRQLTQRVGQLQAELKSTKNRSYGSYSTPIPSDWAQKCLDKMNKRSATCSLHSLSR